jgi:hypothetical protein
LPIGAFIGRLGEWRIGSFVTGPLVDAGIQRFERLECAIAADYPMLKSNAAMSQSVNRPMNAPIGNRQSSMDTISA